MSEIVPLSIEDESAHQAGRELAEARGTSITESVTTAIREAIERERSDRGRHANNLAGAFDAIALHCAELPMIDSRSSDEILGYDDHGVPS